MTQDMFNKQATIYTKLDWHLHAFTNLARISKKIDLSLIKTHHDIACGTGDFVDAISKKGIVSSGSDISPAMISQARLRFPDLRFDVQDMLEFETEKLQDLITINYFSLNMLNKHSDFETALKCIYSALNENGYLVFDFASIGFISTADITDFKHVGDTFICERIYNQGNRCFFELTWFVEQTEGTYELVTERYSEISLTVGELKKLAYSVGFRNIDIECLDETENSAKLDSIQNGMLVSMHK